MAKGKQQIFVFPSASLETLHPIRAAPPPYQNVAPMWRNDSPPQRTRRNTEPDSSNANFKMIAFFIFLVIALGFLSMFDSTGNGKAVVKLSEEEKAHKMLKDSVERERIAWKEERKKLQQRVKDDKKRDKVRKAMERERLQWEKESKKREKLRSKYQKELKKGEEKWKQEQDKTKQWLEKQKKEKAEISSDSKT